ncbi:MAG: amidohydrolase family protein [Vulcanimicrobiaceae bacterium]
MNELVRCSRALVGGELFENYAFVVRDGVIVEGGAFAQVRSSASHLPVRSYPADRLVVPGFVNGHSHAYQILLRGWADDWTFARWRSDALYRVVPQLTPDDVHWIFVAAFSEMLAAGITAVAEFFYLNGTGNEQAEAALLAAHETGIRIVFARAWMDAPYAPPQFRESIDVAAERTLDLQSRYPWANVCVAPHSLHAASPDMIRAAAAFARSQDCRMHVHVAEASYEGEQTLQEHGTTPVGLLDRLDALDERTVAIHAIYIDRDEQRLLGERGSAVIHNPMTNQYLGDGICDVLGLRSRGVRVGLGTDAGVKPSLIDEMRAASYLQKLKYTDGSALGAGTALAMGTREGAAALGIACGDLVAGNAADYVVLDAGAIDPWTPPANALVYRAQDAWVQAAFVGGVRVFTGEPSPLAARARTELARIAKRILP